MDRDELLSKVYDQMMDDISGGNLGCLEELLRTVSDAALIAYLPEENFNA